MVRKPSNQRRTPNSLGSVEQLPSGRFRARYRVEGDAITAPMTFETRTAAEGWLATERADRLRGTWRDPRQGSELLRDYFAAWLASRPNLSPRTAKLYADLGRRWLTRRMGAGAGSLDLGGLTLAQITPATVRRWVVVLNAATRTAALARAEGASSRLGHPARLWALSTGRLVPATGRLSPALLRDWQAAGSPLPGSPDAADPGRTTAAQAYRLLHAVMESARRDGLVQTNPCAVEGAGTVRARERGTASPEEVARLAAEMPEHLRAAVFVAAWSGLRYGELFGLARRHVDLVAGTVKVERALSAAAGDTFGLTKTRGSVRTVALPRFVVELLADHMRRFTAAGPSALVFATATGRPINSGNLSAAFARARARVGRTDLTWHDLRHTGATLAYAAGANVRDVQRRLGHTTTRAAMLYAHAADASDQVIAARLDAAYGEAMAKVIPLRRTGTDA